jgi:hypothetical protein
MVYLLMRVMGCDTRPMLRTAAAPRHGANVPSTLDQRAGTREVCPYRA